jgi:hypothetical protein
MSLVESALSASETSSLCLLSTLLFFSTSCLSSDTSLMAGACVEADTALTLVEYASYSSHLCLGSFVGLLSACKIQSQGIFRRVGDDLVLSSSTIAMPGVSNSKGGLSLFRGSGGNYGSSLREDISESREV